MNEGLSTSMKAALALGALLVAIAIAIVAIGNDDDGGDGIASTGGGDGAESGEAGDGDDGGAESRVEIPDDAVDMRGEATVEIIVLDNVYEPMEVVVSPGTEVVWVNEGRNTHNVFADDGEAFEPITTEDMTAGPQGRTFEAAGSITYYCSIHGAPGVGQIGTIIVA